MLTDEELEFADNVMRRVYLFSDIKKRPTPKKPNQKKIWKKRRAAGIYK